MIAYLAVFAGIAGLVADRFTAWPALVPHPVLYAVGALATAVLAAAVAVYRGVESTPNDAILASARTAGTIFDATYTGQPSFVGELFSRRYWSTHRWRSRPFVQRVPVLVAQDLRVLGRKSRRLAWVAAAALVPALVSTSSDWLVVAALLLGAVAAASTTTATLRADAQNPMMLRLLAVSAREALWWRAIVPSAMASLWTAATLTLLMALGAVPPGPWWALGLAVGPAAATAALRRARLGLVKNGLLPLDTPMGSVETGPVIALLSGYDLLALWALPTIVLLPTAPLLTWGNVLFQAVVSGVGLLWYVRVSASSVDSDLARRNY